MKRNEEKIKIYIPRLKKWCPAILGHFCGGNYVIYAGLKFHLGMIVRKQKVFKEAIFEWNKTFNLENLVIRIKYEKTKIK